MTTRSTTEQVYFEALQRLLKKNLTVSLNAVAVEAGNKPGSLRAARFPNLFIEIQRVMEIQSKQLIPNKEPKFEEKIISREKALDALKKDYAIALQRVVSLERQVFSLQAELSNYRPKKGTLHELPKPMK